MAAPTTVITIVKAFAYRGVQGEEWSNTYMLSGATPADSTAWRALLDAIVVEEKKAYLPATSVIRGYGYDKVPQKGDHAIWSVDLRPSAATVPGTMSITGGIPMAGDQAGWVRWSLDRFNSYGKRVYLRKYFHGGALPTAGGDLLSPQCQVGYNSFGAFMLGGTLLGSRRVVDQFGNVPVATAISPYVTTRTLKRRSKRDPSP
jgi:hypothetical protein